MARSQGEFQGISIFSTLRITLFLFVDDILFFGKGIRTKMAKLIEVLDLLCKATGMHINLRKLTLSFSNIVEADEAFIS